MDIRHITGRISPGPFTKPQGNQVQKTDDYEGPSFKELLHKAGGLEFSGHALRRLRDRSITMDKQGINRLKEAVSRAEQKGSTDSLILDGENAFLVNIPNKTVVTAVVMMELREKVFTNIDSTVLTKQF